MKNIKEPILNYLNSNNPDYALMINGEWGSGKSYYFQEILKNEMQDKFNFILCSAYGISNPNQLISQITIQKNPILKKINGSKPLRIGAHLTSNIFKAVLPALRIGTELSDDESLSVSGSTGKTNIDLSEFWTFKENDVIIIDDIERSKLPIKDLFGFISTNFLNSKSCKVILICSEKELIKSFQGQGDELSNYLRTKEKINRHTVKFEWDSKSIIPIIINETIQDESLQQFLIKDCGSFLYEALDSIQGKNLRKFKFFLSNIETLTALFGIEKIKQSYQSLFIYLFILSLEYIGRTFL